MIFGHTEIYVKLRNLCQIDSPTHINFKSSFRYILTIFTNMLT